MNDRGRDNGSPEFRGDMLVLLQAVNVAMETAKIAAHSLQRALLACAFVFGAAVLFFILDIIHIYFVR